MAGATFLEEKGLKTLAVLPKPLKEAGITFANKFRLMKVNRLKTPIYITLYVTNYCNAKCDHCFYWEELNTGKPELSLDEMKQIAKSLKHPLRTLMLTGGEPFLRKDLADIIIAFHKINKTRRITMPTNGINTERIVSTVETVLKECPDLYLHIQVSIDGPKEMHDKFRRVPGCYDKATATLRRLSEIKKTHSNFDCSLLTTVCTANLELLPDFVKKIKSEFPDAMHKFNILRGSHLGTYNVPADVASTLDADLQKVDSVSPEKLEELFKNISGDLSLHRDQIWQNFQKLKWQYSIQMLKTEKRIYDCTAGRTFGVIYPNGGVSVCEPTKQFANLHDFGMDFAELWKSPSANFMRAKTQGCNCIHPCNMLDSMGYDTKTIIKATEVDVSKSSFDSLACEEPVVN